MMENEVIIETGPLLEQFGQNILAVTPEAAWASTVYDGRQVAVTHNIYDLNIWDQPVSRRLVGVARPRHP